MTPLARLIAAQIAQDGPMPLDRYMALCLGHPQHGYYMTRDPFGAAGDFTTAPEISQVFGELLGVWVAQCWQQLGAPRRFALVELGPGRGTLMADVLRVLAKVPGCREAVQVHFVETSPVLREAQQARVPDATWHGHVASLPAMPTLLLANEFFDALPIRQFERKQGRVFERCVGLDAAGALSIGLAPSAASGLVAMPRGEGVFEDSSLRDAVATFLGDHLAKVSGAALVIDYGHAQSALGDTLQAMKAHAPCAVTDHPGEADVTSHVDFAALGRAFVQAGAKVAGLMTQGDFLSAMGLEARTQVLARTVAGVQQQNLVAASERLAHPQQMGHLFKVMAVTGQMAARPYPFGET